MKIRKGRNHTEHHDGFWSKMANASQEGPTYPEVLLGKLRGALYRKSGDQFVRLTRPQQQKIVIDEEAARQEELSETARKSQALCRYKQERQACLEFAGKLDSMLYELDPRPADKLQAAGELLAALRVQLVDKSGCPGEDELARRRYVDGLQGIADELEALLRFASNELGQSGRGKPGRVRELDEARTRAEARG